MMQFPMAMFNTHAPPPTHARLSHSPFLPPPLLSPPPASPARARTHTVTEEARCTGQTRPCPCRQPPAVRPHPTCSMHHHSTHMCTQRVQLPNLIDAPRLPPSPDVQCIIHVLAAPGGGVPPQHTLTPTFHPPLAPPFAPAPALKPRCLPSPDVQCVIDIFAAWGVNRAHTQVAQVLPAGTIRSGKQCSQTAS
jgi:hypothetical protein